MEKEFKDFEMETPSLTLEPDLGAVEEKEEIAEVAHKSDGENHITIEMATSKEELEKGYSNNM